MVVVACDANICLEHFENSLWFQNELMHAMAPKEASTCRSKSLKGEWIEKTYDYVIAGGCLKGKILQMEMVEDFESGPLKTVSFMVQKTGRYSNGMSRRCLRRYLTSVEAGYQEEALKKRVEKKRRKRLEGVGGDN